MVKTLQVLVKVIIYTDFQAKISKTDHEIFCYDISPIFDLAVKSQGPPRVIISLIPIAHEYPRLHIKFLFPQALEAPDDFGYYWRSGSWGWGRGGGGLTLQSKVKVHPVLSFL